MIAIQFQDCDVRKIAILLLEIHSVSDNKHVGNLKTAIRDRKVDNSARGFIEERTDVYRSGIALAEGVDEISRGESSIDNIFNQEDVSSGDAFVEIFGDLYDTGSWLTGVTRDAHEVD